MRFFTTVIIVFLVSSILMKSNSFSQNFGGCGTPSFMEDLNIKSAGCGFMSDAWLNSYRQPHFWIPDEYTPIKTILVNWIICRNDVGENGWQDIPEFRQQVDLMFSHINSWYSNSQPKGYSLTCEPFYTHVIDTRIRFELNEIIFLDNL